MALMMPMPRSIAIPYAAFAQDFAFWSNQLGVNAWQRAGILI